MNQKNILNLCLIIFCYNILIVESCNRDGITQFFFNCLSKVSQNIGQFSWSSELQNCCKHWIAFQCTKNITKQQCPDDVYNELINNKEVKGILKSTCPGIDDIEGVCEPTNKLTRLSVTTDRITTFSTTTIPSTTLKNRNEAKETDSTQSTSAVTETNLDSNKSINMSNGLNLEISSILLLLISISLNN